MFGNIGDLTGNVISSEKNLPLQQFDRINHLTLVNYILHKTKKLHQKTRQNVAGIYFFSILNPLDSN